MLVSLLALISCYDQNPSDDRKKPAGQQGTAEAAPADYEMLLGRLLQIETTLRETPARAGLVPELLNASFDSVSGTFFAAGKGLVNPSFPAEAQHASGITAAQADARRWTLYMKSWHVGDKTLFGSPIHGDIMYSKTLLERQAGDTVFVLIQVPVGSIVVK